MSSETVWTLQSRGYGPLSRNRDCAADRGREYDLGHRTRPSDQRNHGHGGGRTELLSSNINLSELVVPTLLVAGGLDRTSPQAISESIFDQIASDEKLLVTIPNAVHRSFDSAFCALMHEGASIAQENTRAILERHLATQMLIHPTSGLQWTTVALTASSTQTFVLSWHPSRVSMLPKTTFLSLLWT